MDGVIEKRIDQFNQLVMSQDIGKLPVGLFSGKMGLSIYFYHQARSTGDKLHKKFADTLLESALSQLNAKSLISLEDGLIGICLGLNYLVEKGFQTGNINYILSELDDKIYHAAWFEHMKGHSNSPESLQSIIEIGLYFSFRLQNSNLGNNNRCLFESTVIKAINNIEGSYSYSEIFSEPPTYSSNQHPLANYLYLLAIAYQLGFYNYKIDKVIDEIYPKLASFYPLLQSHRFQLQSSLRTLNAHLKRKSIDSYITRLEQGMDYRLMITTEFRNKNILLANGLCGMYLVNSLLLKCGKLPTSILIDRIVQSELWDDIAEDEVKLNATTGLFTGLAGVILIYQQLTSL
ncbi:MAG: Lanthionine synthetase C-like protein [Bacteroidetes bacterium]|nr:Lanthionine synthetase C-like protein [Bacteroidota bacterium]